MKKTAPFIYFFLNSDLLKKTAPDLLKKKHLRCIKKSPDSLKKKLRKNISECSFLKKSGFIEKKTAPPDVFKKLRIFEKKHLLKTSLDAFKKLKIY